MNPFASGRKLQATKPAPRNVPAKEIVKPKVPVAPKAPIKTKEQPRAEPEVLQDDEDSMGSIPDFPDTAIDATTKPPEVN